ncbi:MAG: sigma 54-interacting transcriptional regulator [Thermincola sp.]|jgi:PAS domain S-box-containing protein/TyrR family helix-turn-helix protein|nr:sigma 54-interacting transcriptional regulator [Thermincola sp.]MDT3703557.1 sigma 54-interacting transcriptional regulator [Thermincola sp.]
MPGQDMLKEQDIPSLFECIHDGVIAINREGLVVVCNQRAREMLETGNDPIGKPITALVPNTQMPNVITTGQGSYNQKFYYKDKIFMTDRTPWLSNGKIVGAVTVFKDITEWEEVVTELEAFKQINLELEGIIESSHDGIIITDGEGKVVKINNSLLRVTDLPRECYLNKKIDKLQEEGYFSHEPIAKRARLEKRTVTGLNKIETGKEVMVTSTPVLDDAGKVVRVVTNVKDMSEITNLQEQLAQSLEVSGQLRTEFNKRMEDELRSHNLITNNHKMLDLVELTRRVADSNASVLLQGESGVGKEVLAKLVHIWSKRQGAFLKVNCSALPGHLLESEIFGYARGAFTGASNLGKPGLFELADEGTLFLDEIEDLPLELQGKFLRVLQDGEFIRLGGVNVIKVNVRIIAASNKYLTEMVQENRFRSDLYYRLNVIPIMIPPLRERLEDIPALTEYFLGQLNKRYKSKKVVTSQLLRHFIDYQWPGNVRELRNVLERLILISAGDVIGVREFLETMQSNIENNNENADVLSYQEFDENIPQLREFLEEKEKELILKAFRKYKNSRRTGEVLGISHTTVLNKLKKYKST